jgi:hypothetical protein
MPLKGQKATISPGSMFENPSGRIKPEKERQKDK